MNPTSSTDLDSKFAQEFEEGLKVTFDSVPVMVFICGKALQAGKGKGSSRRDLRQYLRAMLEEEFKSCRVQFGEHRRWMRIYGKTAGSAAFNLADHEIALASRIDLLVIFPCSPGSFAELGMFSVEPSIAAKMLIFVDSKFRKSRSYVVAGPVAAAKRRNSTVFVVEYSEREQIWKKVRDMVVKIRANKGKAKLLS